MRISKAGYVRRTLLWAIVLLCTLALLGGGSSVLAAGDNFVARDAASSGQNQYTTVEDAWAALCSGKDIIMLKDWEISASLVLTDTTKEHTLFMNGCTINAAGIKKANSGLPAIELKSGAKLTISGGDGTGDSAETEKSCNVFKKTGTEAYSSGNKENITAGGFITNGRGNGYAGAVQMGAGATVTLDYVAIVGNYAAKDGGAVYMNGNGCRLYMQNKAIIQGNLALEEGGGVYVNGDNCSLEISGGSGIEGNIAKENGGGICVFGDGVAIDIIGGSAVSNNLADTHNGGGIYEGGTAFTLKSSDRTGVIKSNRALTGNGGGVYIADGSWSPRNNSVEGLIIQQNTANDCGGGIYVNQRYVTIDACEIIENETTVIDGGGVYINRDYCTVKDSEIRENKTANQGGGVYCDSANDFSLQGTVIIKDNTRSDNSKDDVFLADGTFSKAYVSGDPDPASEIGIRTEEAAERKVGTESITNSLGFFSDFDGWHIERSAGDAVYLKAGTKYLLTVNGVKQALYNKGDTAYIFGGNSDGTKVFYRWKPEAAGVALFDGNVYSQNSYFIMPAKDVSIEAEYQTKITQAELEISAPVGGEPLPAEGKLTWTDSSGAKSLQVPLTWVYLGEDEKKTVAGNGAFNAAYAATAQIGRDVASGLVFSENIEVNLTVLYGNGKTDEYIANATVNAKNTLILYSNSIRTEKPRVETVPDLNISVKKGTERAGFEAMLPKEATLTAEDGKTYTVPLGETVVYPEDSTLLGVDGKVQGNGTVQKALVLENTGLKTGTTHYVTINVTAVEIEPTVAPTATPVDTLDEKTGLKGKTVLLACDTEGATIYYQINGGKKETYTAEGITLPGVDGEEKTYVITAWAEMADCMNSSVVTFAYTLDNPFTVTVNEKLTTGSGETEQAYTAEYHKGETVVIGAPSLGGNYIFEKWEGVTGTEIPASNVTENTFTVNGIESDITVTAVYNPVLYDLKIELVAPVPGERAADKLKSITVNGNDWTEYFDGTVTWSPEMTQDKADYGTAYTASFALDKQAGVTFAVSELLNISVNGGANGIQAAVVKEEGINYVRITFPSADAEQEEEPDEPVKPDPTPDIPVPAPGTEDDDTVTVDYAKCKQDSTCPIATFTDAAPKAWYHDGIHYCLAEGLMNGVGDNKLSPEGKVTRGQIVTILWRLEGTPVINCAMTFGDVGDTWYTEAVRWAAGEGIVTGYGDGRFGPDDNVTREQLATILYNYAVYKGYDMTVDTGRLSYTDSSEISSWARTAVSWASAKGLVNGMGNNIFSPAGTATRSATAMMLQRFCMSM